MNESTSQPTEPPDIFALACWMVGLLLVGGVVPSAMAQGGLSSAAASLTSEERPVQVSFQPTYQRFEDEGRVLTEWSLPVVAVVPFQERWQFRVRGSAAIADGQGLAKLSGLTDVRAALSYARPVGDGSVIVSASVNAPTGKQELTQREFMTATLLSQNFYRFRVPSFGQGVGASVGATWATPVSESMVVGIGGAARYYGSYDPVAGRTEQYDPGEEGRITGGLDYQLTRTSALSGEVSFFLYGTDTVGGIDQFNAGNRVAVRVQYLHQVGSQTLRIVGQYRGQQKSTLPVRNAEDQQLQILPTHGVLRGQYATALSDRVDLQVSAAGRLYDETLAFEQKTLFTVGVQPQFSVGESVVISPRAAYTGGSFTGLEGSLALELRR